MERKSIGSFVAALRRANGLTQRQLAEQLGVSDKTVSRWERDESAPDLSLIPVIAELFGITSDELLRGERRAADMPSATGNQEKRLERILDQTRLQFRVQTVLDIGCAVVGVIAALVGAQYRNIIGFCLGLICYLGAGIATAIAVLKANGELNSDEFDCEKVDALKRDILDSGYNMGSLLAALTAWTALLLNSSLDWVEVVLLGMPLAMGVAFGCVLLKWFLILPRREEGDLHGLRVNVAGSIGGILAVAGGFSLFFWLALEWEAALIVGLVFVALAVPVGLGIYGFQKKRLKK